ncbi:hypothetical protein [Microvirga soli]|uniref:hypothetical protein n=1 Tax=Microvirga soli TaxID=1854496 RepID=UPI00191EB116|nr:hypothetical protein [Microvirga soli]
MNVFLLGAGASKSYGSSPTGQRMPIARDFFQTFDRLAISANPWVLQEGLLGYLLEKGVPNPHDYLRSGLDIEVLHSEIEAARDEAMRSGNPMDFYYPYRAYNELVFLFASVINEIQNGPISEPHRSIARLLGPDDAVVTFNWDTLMDRALSAETPWCADWGYGVTPHRVFTDGWRSPNDKPSEPRSPRLIKLHGSTNWLTAYTTPDKGGQIVLTHELDPGTLHVFEHATEPYACYAGRYMPGYKPFSYGYYPPNLQDVPGRAAGEGRVFVRTRMQVPWKPEGTAAKDGLVSMPLIIPPVKNKTYGMFGSLFAGLWREAEDLLAAADTIVVIGYSFPRTDLQSNGLFLKALMRRSSMPRVVVLDPAPERVAEKFRLDFGISGERLTVIKDYFSETFDLGALLRS